MEDTILRIFYETYSMNYILIAVALLTIVLAVFLSLRCRNVWFNKKNFKWMGLFYSLSAFDSVRIASAWIKLCLVVIFLCRFKPLALPEYFMLAIVGLLTIADIKHPGTIITGFFAILIQIIGLISANVVCSYIIDLQPGFMFMFAYILMAIFLSLYGVYMFLTELNNISKGRSFHEREEVESEITN